MPVTSGGLRLFEEQGRKDQKDTYRIMYDEIVFIVD